MTYMHQWIRSTPGQDQIIIWTNAKSIWLLRTDFRRIFIKKHTFLFKYCVWKYRPWKCRNLFSEHCVQRNGAATAILTRAKVVPWMLCSHHLKAYNVLREFLHSYWDPTEISCVHFPSSIRGQMGARSQSIWENVLYEEVLYVPHLPLT